MAKTKVTKAYVEKFLVDKGYPEVGFFEDDKDSLQKFYKHCTDEQVMEWVDIEGLEFTPSESAPINRMRACMAILYRHYPKAPSAKKKSKYADYTLEQLVTIAIDKDVPVETTDDERIMRMRVIMALRAAGHIA
jgi:hypothetical protein